MHRVLAVAASCFVMAAIAASLHAQAPTVAPVATGATTSAAVLKQYCATCHSDRAKAGGLVIDPAAVANVGTGAPQWEKVVRKLRTQAMPPPGAPRPDAASYNRVASFLETELDRAEAARPHLGKLPLAHRLSRTEYRNAVRDLLALESLPSEVSVDYRCRRTTSAAASTTSPTSSSSRRATWSATSTRRGRSAASQLAIQQCR